MVELLKSERAHYSCDSVEAVSSKLPHATVELFVGSWRSSTTVRHLQFENAEKAW